MTPSIICPDCGAPMRGIGVGLLCTGRRCTFFGGKSLDIEARTKGYGTNPGAKAQRRLLEIVLEARNADVTSAEHMRAVASLRADMPFESERTWRRFCVLMTADQLREAILCFIEIDPEQKNKPIADGIHRVSVSWHDPFTVQGLFWKNDGGKEGCITLSLGSSYCGYMTWEQDKELLLAGSMSAVRSVLDLDETLEPVIWSDATPRVLPKGPVTALYEKPMDILFISGLVLHHRDLRIAKVGGAGLRRERYSYDEVLPAVLRSLLGELGLDAVMELAGKLVIPDSAKVAFPDIPELTKLLCRTELTTEACGYNSRGITAFGQPVADYGLEVVRAVRVEDAPPALEVKFLRGADELTLQLSVLTLASRPKFMSVLNSSVLSGRPLSILSQRACDALRYKLHAELIKRPVVNLVLAPGPGRGAYHLPGLTVSPTEDQPGQLQSPIFRTMCEDTVLASGETLHLLLLMGALLWRHAAGAKVARINIALEHSKLLQQLRIWYGYRTETYKEEHNRPTTPSNWISIMGAPTAGGLHTHPDGLRLAHLPPHVQMKPADWFTHCVRCGLVGNYGTPEGHPTPAALIKEGAGLLGFFGCKLNVRADLYDLPLVSGLLAARGRNVFRWDMASQCYLVSCEDNRRLYEELKAKDREVYTDGLEVYVPKMTVNYIFELAGVL